jgi:hypothetical protein
VKKLDILYAWKLKKFILRADPCYKDKSMWNDWIYLDGLKFQSIDGFNETKIPVHLLGFVSIKGIETPITGFKSSKQEFRIEHDGVYAMVHFVPLPLSYPNIAENWTDHKAHQSSLLMYYSRKQEVRVNRRLQRDILLVDLKHFNSTCIGVPDFTATSTKTSHSFIFMTGINNWMKLYSDHMKQSIGALPAGYHEQETKKIDDSTVQESDHESIFFDMDDSGDDSDSD